mmetsp:Transcript_116638/g.326286  ORF Transcript_116638/g.326286 Transcript_116638/m.326286 type:complete len:242 (-) Transcript_116638:98-823(-)
MWLASSCLVPSHSVAEDTACPPVSAQQLDVASAIVDKFDRKERDVEVLKELRRVALDEFTRACEEGHREVGRGRIPELWVRVLELHLSQIASVGNVGRRFGVRVESGSHLASTSAAKTLDASGHISYAAIEETLAVPLPELASGSSSSTSVWLSVVADDGAVLGNYPVVLEDLCDQRAVHRWCDLHGGWRVSAVFQLLTSPSVMLRSHIKDFEEKLRAARAELAACEGELRQVVPPKMLHR